MSTLAEAIEAIRMGDPAEGRQILEELLEADESNEQVWLWLSAVVDGDEDREVCLDNVLALNPNNSIARMGMDALRAGRFNSRDIISAALGDVEEEVKEPASGPTFLEEFQRGAEGDDDDDELVLPSTMAKSKPKSGKKESTKKKAAKSGGKGLKLNPRLLILAGLVLLIICALASFAAYNMLFTTPEPTGDQPQPAVVPTEVVPTQPAEEAPTATPEPVPPTEPPPPTPTPKPKLELPQAKPTDLPTPTATQVVAPTP
jgi:hypothetical protein